MSRPAGSLGRYAIRATLGRGGFSTVYRAHDTALDREVALKVLAAHLAEDDDVQRRFLTETRLLARLRHPNIVTIHDVGEADGVPFFAMEYIEGHSLAELIAIEGGLSPLRAVALLDEVSGAIDYLHARGLVHRDIKAANMMVAPSGRVVLMDFGIARVLDGTQYTSVGATLGTPEAMSPEQALGLEVGPATDIYALGVLVYRMLSGRPPFLGATPQVLHAHAYDLPPPLHDLRPDLPERLCAAVETALAKDPALRPASATALARALAEAIAPPAAASPTQTLVTPPAPPPTEPAIPAGSVRTAATRPLVEGEPTARITESRASAATPPEAERASRRRGWPAWPWYAVVAALLAGAIAAGAALARSGGQPRRATPAFAAATSSATVPAVATAVALISPTVTPALRTAAQVPDAEVLRSGGTVVQRENIPGSDTDAGQVALFSQTAGRDGCSQPHIDLFRSTRDGKWASVYDATIQPSREDPYVPAVQKTDAGCFPAIKLFAVRPPDVRDAPAMLVSAGLSDGSQRLFVLRWNPGMQNVETLYALHTTPAAQLVLAEGTPATLHLGENAYPPASSGLHPDYSRSTARLNLVLTWQGSSFAVKPAQSSVTFACGSGVLTQVASTDAGKAIELRCPDGSPGPYAAATISGATAFDTGLAFEDLAIGDDVTLQFAVAPTAPADPLDVIVHATTVKSAAALARKLATPTPAPPPAPPRAPATLPPPVRQPAAQPTPQQAQPVLQPTATEPPAPAVTQSPVAVATQAPGNPNPVAPQPRGTLVPR